MEINKTNDGNLLQIELIGRLDTVTAPDLDKTIEEESAYDNIEMDFKGVKYVSSAGLRVLLKTQKNMTAKCGSFVLHNVNEAVMEIFEMTGFADILTIE